MKVSAIGEFGLIERIRRLLPPATHVLLGIGDDCAVLRPSAGRDLLLTTDLLVDRVDFTIETITPFRLGQKAMAVNLSDIAAMGGLPRAALVALALPRETEIEFVEELFRGLQDEGVRYTVEVIGGDLSASPVLMIGVTLVGEVEPGRAVTRSGAKPGDRVWVTGRLGGSAAGLAALAAGFRLGADQEVAPCAVSDDLTEAIRTAIQQHLCPTPRVHEGRVLAEARVASAMIDLSDGLASDLGQVCRESGVSARVMEGQVPVDPAASAIGRHLGKDPLTMAIEGGEDFELLFTSSSQPSDIVRLLINLGPVTEIGRIEEGRSGCLLERRNGTVVPLHGGFDHFR